MNDNNCIFCNEQSQNIISNQYCYIRMDKYPVSNGHILVIPFRHYSNYFDSSTEELQAIWELVNKGKIFVDKLVNPDAYNIGINVGEYAGQTIPHLHIHVIPRYRGDMEDPKGGVRGVIPDKQKY